MIDGIKVKVQNIDPSVWCNHADGLDFDEKTVNYDKIGKFKNGTINGLNFAVIPSEKEGQKEYLEVAGSLHKFYNGGGHNANDFSLTNARNIGEVIKASPFDCKDTILQNIEYGVNIELPFECQRVFNSLACLPNGDTFGNLNFETQTGRVFGGKSIKKQEYEFKIYDKQASITGKKSNILRVEFRTRKMRLLKERGINTLDSAISQNSFFHFGGILLKYLLNVVFVDVEASTGKQRLFPSKFDLEVSRWANPNQWNSKTPMQRQREFDKLKSFDAQYRIQETGRILQRLVFAKVCELSEVKDQTEFKAFLKDNYPSVLQDLEPVLQGEKDKPTPSVKTETETDKKTVRKFGVNHYECRNCPTCKKDISLMRLNAVYCSVGCKNTFHNPKRKKQVANETETTKGKPKESKPNKVVKASTESPTTKAAQPTSNAKTSPTPIPIIKAVEPQTAVTMPQKVSVNDALKLLVGKWRI